jgi:23S rRNA pseudouridine1911/1915/1917 synthase
MDCALEGGGRLVVKETKDEGDLRWRVPDGPLLRLDTFVCQHLPHLSLRQVHALLKERGCTVNGHGARKGTILFPGDWVLFCGDPRYLAAAPIVCEGPLAILFEDEWLIAVDKPSGLPTHGQSGKDDATLVNRLLSICPELAGVGRSRWEPGIVHRLDRDTSGIVLAAKQQAVFEHVRNQFEKRTVGKFYRVIVHGKTPGEGWVDYPLTHDSRDRRKMRPCLPEEKPASKMWDALTHFRTLGRRGGWSHLEVQIATGVTHQIRVHMKAIGHPVIGDPLYGSRREQNHRCMLHAQRLELVHPGRDEWITIRSPLPAEFERFEAVVHLDTKERD